MAQLPFNKLGIKLPNEKETFEFNGQTIEVESFLNTFTKIHMVSSAVKTAAVEGYVNEMVLEASLHFLIIENYTNLKFTDKHLANMVDTFDLLYSSGLMSEIINRLPEGDYDYLFQQSLRLAEKFDKLAISSLQGYAGQKDATESLESLLETTSKPALKTGK